MRQSEEVSEKHFREVNCLLRVFAQNCSIFVRGFVANGAYFMRPIRKGGRDDAFDSERLDPCFEAAPLPKTLMNTAEKSNGLTTWGGKAMLPRRGGLRP